MSAAVRSCNCTLHRQTYDAIPGSVRDLIDDPFRSLASKLRRVGGFAKPTMPFSEFLWADFLRRQIDCKLIERDFARAVERALKLAKAPAANYLPGWCGFPKRSWPRAN